MSHQFALRLSLLSAILLALLSSGTLVGQIRLPRVDLDNTPLDPDTWDARKWVDDGETIFSGQSGRTFKIRYTIKNSTDRTVKLTFRPTGNTATLRPGETTTCNSPAKTWGSEDTGARYLFPKVIAVPTEGRRSGWTRTIKTEGGKYRIVERDDGGVQVVP